MDIQIGTPAALNYLWLVLCAAVVVGLGCLANQKARNRFATSNLISTVLPMHRRRFVWIRNGLMLFALAAISLSLTDIRWGKTWREVPQRGIEVVFALDVSRSMLAEDVAPNRLARAKRQIKDVVDEMAGDRVGLVVFAGDAVRKIPLTSHYNDFKRALDEVGPHDVTHGGSNLGQAVRISVDSFLAKTGDHKAIVLFTDGEDHESDPIRIAKAAHAEHGIRLFTIGIGDDRQGARVPMASKRSQDYLQHEGEQVWSKLDGRVLKEMAQVSGGAYIPAGTKQVDMSQVYDRYVSQVEEQDFETARINGYIPRFQWFLGAGLLLMFAETTLGLWAARPINSERRNPVAQAEAPVRPKEGGNGRIISPLMKNTAALIMAILFAGTAGDAKATEPNVFDLATQAEQAVQQQRYDEAIEMYAEASSVAPDQMELVYNQAIAHYRADELAAARELFTKATSSSDRQLEAKARFNLANCDYREALALAGEDRETAKAKARSAISHYRGALNADPSDSDARTNIELAAALIRQLEEEEKQEQQQEEQEQDQESQGENGEQQDQQQDQNSDSNKDSQTGNQSDSEQNSKNQDKSEGSESENDNSQSDSESGASKDDASDNSESNDNESGESDEERSQSKQESAGNDSASEEQESEEKEKEAKGKESKTTDSAAQGKEAKPQSTPSANQRETSEVSGESESEESQSGDEMEKDDRPDGEVLGGKLEAANDDRREGDGDLAAVAAESDKGKPMTRQEAMKMLQAVRDRDLMRRMQNARRTQKRYIPGAKDW